MDAYYGAVSERAKTVILKNGGTVESEGSGFRVNVEAALESSSDRGAWGNLSVRIWRLPDGNSLVWDSDARELQIGYRK